MKKSQVCDIVLSVVSNYLESQGIETEVGPLTILFGEESILDSIGLVNIVIDIESELLEKGYEISLTSDKAMSRRQSPFRSVETLVDYIFEQINE